MESVVSVNSSNKKECCVCVFVCVCVCVCVDGTSDIKENFKRYFSISQFVEFLMCLNER